MEKISLDIILPVHNEEKSIRKVIEEIYEEFSQKISPRFIVCEDGSTDSSLNILKKLAKKYPLKLISSKKRKGYSRAIIDGYRLSTADFVLTVDSDGQCDPKDFWKFWNERNAYDVIIGWRTNRQDHFQRKFLSSIYNKIHKILFKTPIHDPSCPYVLIKRPALLSILPFLGILEQGFWWEFMARAIQRKLSIAECPVNHRQRLDGKTRVYTLRVMPKIGFTHIIGLLRIWLEGLDYKKRVVFAIMILNIISKYKLLLILLLINFLWLLMNGYSCIRSDCHYYYLPIIKHLANPALYPNDPFLIHASIMPSVFYGLIALGSRYINIQYLMLFLLFISDFTLLYAVFKLSQFLFRNLTISFISVFLMILMPFGTLAYSYPQQVVHAMTFTTPFLLLSLVFYLENKKILSFLLAGIMFNFHPVSSLLLLSLLGMDLLFSFRKQLPNIFWYLLAFAIPAVPTFIQLLSTQLAFLVKDSASSSWLKIVTIRSPHHLFPFLWKASDILSFLIFLLFFLLTSRHIILKKKYQSVLRFFLAILLLCFLGIIFSEIIPLRPLIQLTPFRATVFFKFLALPFIARFLYYAASDLQKIFSLNLPLTKGLPTILLSFMILNIYSDFRHKNFPRIDFSGNLDIDRSGRNIALLVKKLTPSTAIIITPPYETGFRTDSERTIVGDWKSGGLSIWDVPYSIKWWSRMDDLSGGKLEKCSSYENCFSALKEGYDALSEDKLIELVKKYQASFFVSHNHSLNFPILAQNMDYVVYDLRNIPVSKLGEHR